MRKKTGSATNRKKQLGFSLARKRVEDDSADWFVIEADLAPPKLPARAKSRRRTVMVGVLAVASLAVSLPLAAKWSYEQIFFHNEEFTLRSLIVKTDGVLSEARLAEIANVSAGMNLMKLDLNAIRQQIEKLPQVEKVSVTREMPDRLNLVVRERMPVAWLCSPPLGIRPWDMERGFLMDEEGYLFRCLDLNDGMKSLPVVELFKMAEPTEGTKIESQAARAGLKLIIESDRRFIDHGMTVAELKVRDEWAIECVYQNELSVTYGVFDFSRGLDDLALIMEQTAGSGQSLATVNVVAEKNIPVTFLETAISSVSPESGESGMENQESVDSVKGQKGPDEHEKHLRSILKGG